MLESMNEWTEAIDKGHQVDLIYFDIAKAFDRVPHCQLHDKFQELKLNKNLVSWIAKNNDLWGSAGLRDLASAVWYLCLLFRVIFHKMLAVSN
ncbi:hypothetical protein CRE_02698 [Caenorhabditis remanei]|uniref:Reverse transcriptase domain-containing protein n=1 Tax=Caenorhabditis remanei TaxID=31234 RepID=E3NKZ5_CAERE|nr:hypothetical protein CRE_02698 [Caenorhabditis remanei]